MGKYQEIRRRVIRLLQERRAQAIEGYHHQEEPSHPLFVGTVSQRELEGTFSPRETLVAVLYHESNDETSRVESVDGGYVFREGQEVLEPIWQAFLARRATQEANARTLAPDAVIEDGRITMPVEYFLRVMGVGQTSGD